MKKPIAKRHFPYKHPTFGTRKNPKPAASWQGTVYYWWWQYLRRSDAYIRCCDRGGRGRLAALYQDFGDVREDDFRTWWLKDSRGLRLFSEPRGQDDVRVLQQTDQVCDPSEALTISLPLYLPRRYLERNLKRILKESHPGKRGVQLAKQSRARYKVRGQPNTKAMARGLLVYDRWRESGGPLWKIGNELPGIHRTQKISSRHLPSDVLLRKRALAATVRRYLTRVQRTITNTESGIFP